MTKYVFGFALLAIAAAAACGPSTPDSTSPDGSASAAEPATTDTGAAPADGSAAPADGSAKP